MSNKTFTFDIIKTEKGVSKKGTEYYILKAYCNFDFVVRFFLSPEQFQKYNSLKGNKDFDINNYISVYFNKKQQCFSYYFNID